MDRPIQQLQPLPTASSSTATAQRPISDAGEALVATLANAVQALGRGFDVTSDTRLLYCKGAPGSRLVRVDESHARTERIPDFDGRLLHGVPADVRVHSVQDLRGRRYTPALPFLKMAEYFNQECKLTGQLPLGSFNSMFSFTGPWKIDAASTKSLAMDGYFIPLYKVNLDLGNPELMLREDVKHSIPRSWEPAALASFIENYGTHVITSVTIGGRDVVYVKQHNTSLLSASEIDSYVRDVGNQRFSLFDEQSTSGHSQYTDKRDSFLLSNREIHPQPSSMPHLSSKEDITVIFRRRGGDDLVQNLKKWADTVASSPDIINMSFLPIASLLNGLPGSKHLSRAIELYLEYKPPIEELQYFLDFQIHHVWAPEDSNVPGHARKEPVCPSLQYSLMGPKLYISSEQITVGRKPVTGLRLRLEGAKQNRLAIHIQHLASLPKILQPHWDSHMAIGAPKWQGPEEQDSRWFEPIKWKNFAHVSTAPIENTETNIGDLSGVYIVTGAQLGVWDFGAKSVLHLKLLFSKVPGCTIRRSVWDHSPSNSLQPGQDDPSSSSSEKRSDEKKVDVSKLAKIIDTSEMHKGPQDTPGHWLVTGAKLGIEKGKIVVRVKYSLLNY